MQRKPLGYRSLLTWQQAGEIYRKTKNFTAKYLDKYRDARLLGHMNDSARSVQRNIEEGFKRITTKEYVEFLGFSRASLEELKRDFEELQREFREGIRREDKGREGKIREDKGVIGEIEMLLDLIYGEDCMQGRQIKSLEKKMVDEKTLPQNKMIMKNWKKAKEKEQKFWVMVKKDYGLERSEDGKITRVK